MDRDPWPVRHTTDEETLKAARLLIVDDEPANVRLLERLLGRAGYTNLRSTTDARQVVPLALTYQPDLLLLDLLMPHLDGFAVMQELAPHLPADSFLPIIVLTADITAAAKQRALAGGATDFLTKPVDPTELLLRIRNLLAIRFLQLHLQQQNQLLERLYQAAQAALQGRDQSLSAITHDLGQPLAALNVATRLLGRQVAELARAEPAVSEELASIDASVARLWALIGELSDLARLQAGRPLELHEQPMDLVALVRREAGLHQLTTDRHQIRVETAATELIGEWDPDRLARVVSNLLANAITYSPAGGAITITLAEQVDEHGRWVVLQVRDEGVGIPAADLPFVFDRYYRGANVARRLPGSGLGLAAVRQIVEQHGGAITLASTEGAGTTVTVRLPRC